MTTSSGSSPRPARHPALWLLVFVLATAFSVRVGGQTASPSVASAKRAAALLPDDAVRGAVVAELARDRHLVASGITTSVSLGIVELGGSVGVLPWRERAERVCRVVTGVRAVVNRIRVVVVRRPDPETAAAVRRAVRATDALARMRIHVAVSDGIVELSGAITSFEEQELAERVASSVPGVRFCQNLLSADLRITRTQEVLAADVRSRLEWDPLVAHDPIRVEVRGTRVLLSGTVGGQAEAERAFELAWVKNVTSVDTTDLRLDSSRRPNPNVRAGWPSDSEISATIPELARHWPSVPMASLKFAVLDRAVTLRGTVPTRSESLLAAQAVRTIVGVVKIDNQLRGPWWKDPTPPPPRKKKRSRRRAPRR